MWLIAGPNGSGKSTIVEDGFIERISNQGVRKINPDLITRDLLTRDPSMSQREANLEAMREVDGIVDQLVSLGESFAIETVLSTDKYKPRVEKWQKRGFRVALIFVTLATPQDSLARIQIRVAQGGHDVPADKVIARWDRSLKNLAWFASRADFAMVFDNTVPGNVEDEPVVLASKEIGGPLILHHPHLHPRVRDELRAVPGIVEEVEEANGSSFGNVSPG
jgi:predicted ABC-type ATPase